MIEIQRIGPVAGKIETNFWKFPGGEVGVRLQLKDWNHGFDRIFISVTGIPTSDDIFNLMNTLDALKRMGIPASAIDVFIPYLPYARQDRVCHEGESFALKVFHDVICTNLHFENLIVWDIHSDVMFNNPEFSQEFVSKVTSVSQSRIMDMKIDASQYDYLIAPDAGAAKKLNACNVVTLSKTRLDGKVVHAELDKAVLSGKVLVVDDICDGGATFNSITEMLKRTENRPKQLDLFVTHGIFSKGLVELHKNYDNIFCANVMNPLVFKDENNRVYEKELS